jgi:hypothetical protein
MTAAECLTCDRPSPSGFLCTKCVAVLRGSLEAVPFYMPALREAVARQVQFGPQAGGAHGRPLVFNVDASNLLAELTSYLTGVAGAVADRLGEPVRYLTAVVSARYLLSRVDRLNTFRGIGELHDVLGGHVANVVKLVDVPVQPVYLGVCGATSCADDVPSGPCDAVLWASPTETTTRCKVCGATHSVETRKVEISDRVWVHLQDRVMTATDAADALIAAGLISGDPAKVVDKIRKLARPTPSPIPGAEPAPARLVPRLYRTVLGHARPAYRVGDVLELLTKTSRKTKTGAEHA